MDFSEMISSIILNVISSDIYEGKLGICRKCELYFFRKRINKDIRRYINSHDGSVLTTGAFENYLIRYNIVENILAYVSGYGDSIPKIDYMKELVTLFAHSGLQQKHCSIVSLNEISEFLCFLHDQIDVFYRKRLSENERYLLRAILSSKTEIMSYFDMLSRKAIDSLHSIENDLTKLKNDGSFSEILDSVDDMVTESKNTFHYLNSQMVKLYGRDSQLALLNEFLDSSSNYSFCVITGPGGIGKSKLAFSFMQQQKKYRTDWNMCFVNNSILSKMAICKQWNHRSNTLLIVDYAASAAELLHEIFVKIADNEIRFNYKLRVILLDRVGMTRKNDSNTNEVLVEFPYWYTNVVNPQTRDVYPDAEHISKYLFADFIELEGLSEEDYRNLISDYVISMHKRKTNKDKHLITCLEPEQITEIIDFSKRSSNSHLNSRPLYIMLATDAIINGRDISRWGATQMMQYIYDRDRKQWRDSIQDDIIGGALENALMYSTIFGEWSIETLINIGDRSVNADIEKGLKTPGKEGAVRDWLAQMCECQDYNIWSLKMRAYEPDIVGEFYVLRQLESCIATKKDWCNLMFDNLGKSRHFLERACQDYANTNLSKILLGILNELTSRVTKDYVVEAEWIIRVWEFFHTEVDDKTQKAVARTGIQAVCKKLQYQSKYIDETNIRFFYANPAEHTNTWREHRFPEYKQFYKSWPDSSDIASTYIEELGEMASWYYRNGNVPKGNAYSRILNGVISKCNIHDGSILIKYIDALGSIISGHYYMNDDADIEAEIDDSFKLEALVAEFKTESHAIAYVDAIKKVIIQQAKYTDDRRIDKSIEQFCTHVYAWMVHEDWFVFRWNVGSVIPLAVDLLFTHQKQLSGKKLLASYFSIFTKYIKTQYEIPNLMISHFSTGLDKLLKSPMIPEDIKTRICNVVSG